MDFGPDGGSGKWFLKVSSLELAGSPSVDAGCLMACAEFGGLQSKSLDSDLILVAKDLEGQEELDP